MTVLDRHGATVAAASGGLVAAYSVLESSGYSGVVAESLDVWYGAFVTPQWAGTIAVVAAVLSLVALQIRDSSRLVAASAVVGTLVIALPSFAPIADNQAVTTNAIGAGLLLGSVAAVAAGHRRAQCALALGIVGAVVFQRAADAQLPPRETRFMVAIGGALPVNSTIPVAVLAVVAVLVAGVALRSASGSGRLDVPSTIVFLALPFGLLMAYVYLGSFTSTTTSWIVAATVSLALVLAASRLVDARDGDILLAGFAVAAASVNGLGWGPTSWWIALVGVGSMLLGAVVGVRRPSVKIAAVLLAAVTASGLLVGVEWLDVVPTVAYAVVFPFAASMAVCSCLPVGVAASVVGPMIPVCMTLFSATAPAPPPEFGWTSGLAEDYVLPTVISYSPSYVAVVVAALSVVAVGAARR